MKAKDHNNMKLEKQLCFPLYAASREVIKGYRPYLDELGLRCYKPVELGLETMDYIEIRSGLSEGDSVILS